MNIPEKIRGLEIKKFWSINQVKIVIPDLYVTSQELGIAEVLDDKITLYSWVYVKDTDNKQAIYYPIRDWPDTISSMFKNIKPYWEYNAKRAERLCDCDMQTLMIAGCKCGGA